MTTAPTRVLFAWLEGRPVGRFTLTRNHGVVFAYDDQAGPTPVSLSLPRDGGWSRNAPHRFLDNLLPDDERTRARIAHDTHAASATVVDLLAQIGGDVAGGLVLTGSDQPPTPADHPMLLLTDDDIAYRVATLHVDPDRWMDADLAPGRFSLAGTQAKFAMARIGRHWYQPGPAVPSTHIVKPGSDKFTDVEVVEDATTRLARLCGVPAPRTAILTVLGEHALIVERFDRDTTTTPVTRVHAEDFAQAAGMPGGLKYTLTAAQAVRMLHRHDPTDTLGYQFIHRLAFAVSTGNCDAHAKNYSLLIRPTGVTLAPAYDQLPTLCWPGLDTTLAMRIGDATTSAAVTPHHWATLARDCGLDADHVTHVARTMSTQALTHAEQAVRGLPARVSERMMTVITHANRGMAHV